MKTVASIVAACILAGGCYIMALVFVGTVPGAYAVSLVLMSGIILFCHALPHFVWMTQPYAINLRRFGDAVGLVTLSLYIGFITSEGASIMSHLWAGVGFITSCVFGGLPLLMHVWRQRRWFKLGALLGTAITLGLWFQPPLEGGGRLMQHAIDLLIWSYAEPARSYWMTFVYLALAVVAGVAWVYSSTVERERAGHIGSKVYSKVSLIITRLVLWIAGLAVGLLFVLFDEVFTPTSAVPWYALLQAWAPSFVAIWVGVGLTVFVEPEGRSTNWLVALFMSFGVVLFSCLGPGLTVLERLLIASALVMGMSACVGVRSWRSLRLDGASRATQEASLNGGLIAVVVATSLFMVVWTTCPVTNHMYPLLTFLVCAAMFISAYSSVRQYGQTRSVPS
jgi:hypothetical protein